MINENVAPEWEFVEDKETDELEYLLPRRGFNGHKYVMDYRADRIVGFLHRKNVLDIGCGCGYMAKRFSEVAKSVTGIDRDNDAIKYAKEHYPGVSFLVMDIRTIRFEMKFDAIVAAEVLEHMTEEDGLKTMNGVIELLRPGGLFIGCVPTIDDTATYKWHKSFYNKEKLDKLLKQFFQMVIIEKWGSEFVQESWFFRCWKGDVL